MMQKAVFPGQYIQGAGAINELPLLIKSLGKNGMILASKSVKNEILPKFFRDELQNNALIELFNGECTEQELDRIARIIEDNEIDVVVGMGGGKVIDTAKISADRAKIEVIIIPTVASSDDPCSGCAVTYTELGEFEAVLYQKRNPAAVLVDLDIIANSPVRLLVAGMGDALATYFEARSCHRTQSVNECGGMSTLTGLNIAKLCYDTLLKYGLQAKIACEKHIVTPALTNITEANILLSGIGFESSGIAAAHAIHNGLTALAQTHPYFHGEKVAFGTLTQLHLISAETSEIDEVYSFCELVGLPTTLAEIGISEINEIDLKKVAEKSCEPDQAIHHEAGEITPKKVMDAIIMADAYGRMRKAKSK